MSRFGQKKRILIVANPRTCQAKTAELWRAAREALERDTTVLAELETRADGGNPVRIGKLIADAKPELVVVAGGDGTVREVVQGLMSGVARGRAGIAIVPLGTANNFARNFGLTSCRHKGRAATDAALAAIHSGDDRWVDIGNVDGHYFVGSFALGMDADILRTRNQYATRFARSRVVRGYPLYLWSCALNLMRRHGTRAQLSADGKPMSTLAYNLLVTNTSIYAGEFRFGGKDGGEDGALDLHLFEGAVEYVMGYREAWLRHLRHGRGRAVGAQRKLIRVRSLSIRLDAPVEAQIDGEQMDAIEECTISVVPQALSVCVPKIATVVASPQPLFVRPTAEQWASSAAH